MAKTSVAQWDTTAGNNTDINSVNIDEGCSPAGINNAIREVMAQIAVLYPNIAQVTGAAFTGDTTFSDNVSLIFGAGPDGDIYSDGTDLTVEIGNSSTFRIKNAAGEHLARFYSNNGVDLSYNNTTILQIGNGTVVVNGSLDADSFTGAGFLDEDDMSSDAADKVASQQSIKAYVGAQITSRVGTGDFFESTGNSYTNGGLVTIAHGLGATPKFFSLVGLCGTDDAGYTAGMRVEVPSLWISGSNYYGATTYADATNVYIQIGATSIRTHSASGLPNATWTPANWTLEVRAWV